MSVSDEQDSTASSPPTPKKKGRWKRRFKITAIVLITLAIVLRVVVIFALPTVISRVARFYDLDIRCDRQTLALFGGNMGLWGVKVYPRGGGDALLSADYVHGEIVPWELLKGRLHVLRAEADGVDLLVQRTSDGRIPLLEKFASNSTTRPASTNAKPGSIDFTSPLILEALRLTKIQARVRDDSVTPALDTRFEMDLRVSNVGADQTRPIDFEITAWADQVLDSLRVQGTASGSGPNLDANAHVTMRGLHPQPLLGYLAPLGLKPQADSIGMDASATLKARAVIGSPQTVAAGIVIDHVRFTADDADFATLKSLQIDADKINSFGANVTNVLIDGAHFAAARDAGGALHIAGLATAPVTAGAKTAAASSTGTAHYPIGIGEVKLHDIELAMADQSSTPPVELKAIVSDFALIPRAHSSISDLKGAIAMPGIAKSVRIDGAIDSSHSKQTAQLALNVQGIRPDALRSVLSTLGVESELHDAQLAAVARLDLVPDAQGNLSSTLKISNVKFSDDSDLLAMPQIDVVGAKLDPADNRLHIDSVDLRGPGIRVTRNADGGFEALGLKIHPRPSTQPSSTAMALPRLEVGRFTWKDAKLTLVDRTTPKPTQVSIDDAGVEIKDLFLDLAAKPGSDKSASEKTGSIHAWLHSPELAAGGFDVTGTLTPGPQSLAAKLDVRGEHLQTVALAPYLSPLGIEPTLHDGTVKAHADVGVISGFDRGITSVIELSDATLQDGTDELAGVDSLKIDSATLKGGELNLGNISIHNPRGRATRTADGAIELAGVRIHPDALQAASTASPTTASAATAPSASAPTTAPSPFVATLKQLSVDNGQFHVSDQKVDPNLNTTAYVTAKVNDLTLGRHASPATFALDLSCEGIVDELKVDGEQLDPTPGAELVKMTVSAKGVRGTAIDGYLPPGVKTDVADGRFNADILASRLQGVTSAFVDLSKVDWRDGDSKKLLSMDLARIAASNLDWSGNAINVEEVSLNNFESSATIDANGNPHVAGIMLVPPAPVTQPTTVPANEESHSAEDVARPLPNIVVQKIDLNVAKFTLRDERRPGAAPVEISDLRFRNTAPITLGGQAPESQPPAHLELTGTIGPVVQKFTVNIDTAPFAPEPIATVDLFASGISGDGVTALLPELSKQINGGQMTDGRFHAHAEIHAKFEKRGPRDFQFLSRAFDLDLSVKDVAFRDHDVGRVLAGVDQVTAETIHVEPQKGNVRIKSLEINTPIGYASREIDGIHAMGMVVSLPSNASPSTMPTTAPLDVAATPASPSGAAPTTAPSNAGQIQIDRLQITGADLKLEDHSVDPPLVVPVKSIDVEVRDLSTQALHEDRPIRFNAVVESDKVMLPVRGKDAAETKSAISGMPSIQSTPISSAMKSLPVPFLGGKPAEPEKVAEAKPAEPEKPATSPTSQPLEARELFSQVTASGSVSLYPAIHGYTKTSVNGFELASLKGEASGLGVDLDSGIFDMDVNTRFNEGAMDLRSKSVFTDLRLTEPEHGPIQTRLGLSVPMDVVLPLLRDPDGGITIPINVPLENGKVSTGNLIGAGVGALTQIMVTAVASAPVKAIGGVTDVLNMGKQKTKEPSIVKLTFKPGDVAISSDDQQQINQLIVRMKKDPNMHATIRGELSPTDTSIAYERANPPAEDCKALAQKLRDDRVDLDAQRAQLANQASAQLASSAASAQDTLGQLADLNRQISQTDEAMDHLYDMLRPGASNQASRRARAASLQIATTRLNAVNDALVAANLPDSANRIEKTTATDKLTEDGGDGTVTVTVVQRKRQK